MLPPTTETPNDRVRRGVLDKEFMDLLQTTSIHSTFMYHGQSYKVLPKRHYMRASSPTI